LTQRGTSGGVEYGISTLFLRELHALLPAAMLSTKTAPLKDRCSVSSTAKLYRRASVRLNLTILTAQRMKFHARRIDRGLDSYEVTSAAR